VAVAAPDSAPFPLGSNLYKEALQKLRQADCRTAILTAFPFPAAHSPGIKLRKGGQFPHVLLFHSAGLQLALRWRQGLTHPLEASLGLSLHQSRVTEEGPKSTEVQPDGEGAQGILWSLRSSACLNSQSNMCLPRQFSQNIYFVHCNLSTEPCIILLSVLFCLLILKFRTLLPCDLYTLQSQLFRSSARYFERNEPLSLPSSHHGQLVLCAKVQLELNLCLVLSLARLPKFLCFPLEKAECQSWEVCQRHKEEPAGLGSTAQPAAPLHTRGLHQCR